MAEIDDTANKARVKAYNAARYIRDKNKHLAKRKEWYQKNRERILEDRKCQYYGDSEFRSAKVQYASEWQKDEKNKDAVLAKNARWAAKNPERRSEYLIAYNVEWREKNPGYYQRCKARNPEIYKRRDAFRRALKQVGGGSISDGLVDLLWSEQGGVCPYCDRSLNKTGYHLDHYVPLKGGGLHCDNNMQLLCPRCNLSKSSKCPIKFAIKSFAHLFVNKLGHHENLGSAQHRHPSI